MPERKNEFCYGAFEIKSTDDATGVIEGFASVFGNKDSYNDIMMEGSFTKTIKEHGGKVPVLSNHDFSKQIGWGLEAEEQKKGLFVRGQLEIADIPEARAHYALIKRSREIGTKAGLSFGFITIKYDIDKDQQVRKLKEVKLLEWSPVTFPANPKAFATAAKAWLEVYAEDLDTVSKQFLAELKQMGHTEDKIFQALNRAATPGANPDEIVHLLQEQNKKLKSLLS